MLRAALVLVLSLSVAQAEITNPPARFSWITNGAHRVLVHVGPEFERSANLRDILQVHVEQQDLRAAIDLPSISGRHQITTNGIEFRPQFPFQAGVKYRATFRPPGEKAVSSVFEIPLALKTPSTVVTQIYPTAEVLPENLLKFYLYFSAPMSGGHIYEHILLINERGQSVELPFLEIDEELWNSDMTRLTLFLDPGRIKRGVKPLEEVGPALEEGKSYTLKIAEPWSDATGTPLKQRFEKKFRIAPSDRDPPDIAQWKITEPNAGTRDPLKIEFTDPMDHALALRMINIKNIPGEKNLTQNEKLWTFVPEKPWPPGEHQLLVQTTIEDLAGNNPGKPFEVDLFSEVEKRITRGTIPRTFVVK